MRAPMLHQNAERRGRPSGTLFENDVILTHQFTDRHGRRSLATERPEARLALAVLEEALANLQQLPATIAYYDAPFRRRQATTESERIRRRDAQAEHDDARAWFASDDARWPFAFVRICDYLGLDAGAIRAVIADPERLRAVRLQRVHCARAGAGLTRRLGHATRTGAAG